MVGRILWNAGNVILLALALTRESVNAVVLGRYSITYALGLAFGLALLAGVAMLTLTPPGRRLWAQIKSQWLSTIAASLARTALFMATVIIGLILFASLPFSLGFILYLVLFNVVLAVTALATSSAAPRRQVPVPQDRKIGRILWNVGNLILLALVLARESDAAVVLGRYSLTYALGLAFSLALVAGVAALTLTQPGRRLWARTTFRWLSRIAPSPVGMGILVAGVIAGLTLVWSLPFSLGYILHLVLFNIVMAAAALASSSTAAQPGARNRALTALQALLIVVLAVSLWSAHAVPPEHSYGDEPAWTNMAVTLATTGQAYIKFSGQEQFPITPGVGWWIAPYALWIKAFGVSLAAGRVFIWLAYVAAVACTGWAGARLYDRHTGLAAALLTAVSPLMLSYRIIRPEIGLAAVGALVVLAWLASQKRALWAFVAGWLAIFSLEIHAAGLAYIVALLIMFGLDGLARLRKRRNPFTRQVFAVVAGMGVGTLIYLGLHVLIQPEPEAYLAFLRSTRSFLSMDRWLEWVSEAGRLFWGRSPLELVLTAAAVVALIARRTPGDRVVLRFFAATLVSYFVLVPESHRYLVVFMPFIAWGNAALISYGFRAAPAPPRPVASLLALAAVSAPFLAVSLPGLSVNPMPAAEPPPIVERVRALSSPNDVIVSDLFTYWWLSDYPELYVSQAEYELTRGLGYTTGEELWAALDPMLVVQVYSPGFPRMPPALEEYLTDQQYELVETLEWEGNRVEIYLKPTGAA